MFGRIEERYDDHFVTNLIQQAQRISDHVMFLNDSQIVEMGDTQQMFSSPKQELTKKYLSGEMG